MRVYRFVFLLLVCAGIAAAQTENPADEQTGWAGTVRALAEGLVAAESPESLREILPPGVAIRQFDRLEPDNRLSLRAQTSGGVIVAAFAYDSTPATLAGDLNLALRDANFIPEAIKSDFLIDTDEGLKRANETAAQWVATTIQPGVEQPVGVIVLWRESPLQTSGDPADGQLVFLLLTGREFAMGHFRVSAIVYGGPHQILR